jgi:hypothetical protein
MRTPATRTPQNPGTVGRAPGSPAGTTMIGRPVRVPSPEVVTRFASVSGGRIGLAPAPEPAPPGGPAAGPGGPGEDRSGVWLRNAAAGLGVLAAAAAVVSFAAQYRMIYATRGLAVVAGLEAAIPDAAALVFACLGVALALQRRRAVRPRVLNVAAVGTSVFMNAIAAAPGWRSVAIWVLPPVAYALASDTLIGVVRAWAITRPEPPGGRCADEEATPLGVVGGLILWLLRLALAPASTLAGFRAWVLAECPVAPGRRELLAVPAAGSQAARAAIRPPVPARTRFGTKTARFLALVAERHGSLAAVPVGEVSKICSELAPQAGLNTGAARTALRRAVLAAQDGAAR